MMAALIGLTGALWAFIRSDPGSIRRLNAVDQWSTWQATGFQAARAERVSTAPALERRSLRRRRRPT